MQKYFAILIVVILVGVFLPQASQAFTNNDSVQIGQTVTTGAPPVIPPSPTVTTGTQLTQLQIYNFVIKTDSHSATLQWQTNFNSSSKVSWGTSADLRDGQLLNSQLEKTHNVSITNLLERTTYFFLVIATDSTGKQINYSGQFYTAPTTDTNPPANVSKFAAIPRQSSIYLRWQNPQDPDFSLVRIVRSNKFFPLDPYNGQVVYEGQNEFVEDTNVNPGQVYYYSAFSKDASGNFSSGSSSYAMILWYSESNPNSNTNSNGPVVDIDFVHIPFSQIPSILLTPNDFNYSYNNGQTVVPGPGLVIPNSAFLKIALPKDKLLADAQFMMMSVKDKRNKTGEYFYLFSYNEKTGNYEAEFPRFLNSGEFTITIILFNSAKQVIQDIAVSLSVLPAGSGITKALPFLNLDAKTPKSIGVILVLALGLILFITITIFFFWRIFAAKRSKRE